MSDALGDFSMFELFKQEAEMHCAALNGGLLALENEPEDISRVEPLMRAAHSIKGAARIIGFDAAVTLAHAMEECLVAVQRGTEQLTSGRVDQLLRGVDLLEHVSTLAEDQIASWTTAHGATIDSLSAELRQPAPTAGPSVEERRPNETPGANPPDLSALADVSMVDLFKQEAEAHCAALNEGLLGIESAPGDLERIEPMMRAAHSIKGAARIIGLDAAVTLAHAMEDCLVAAQRGRESLVPGRVDQLLRGVDLLQHIANLGSDHIASWSVEQGAVVEGLAQALREPAPPDRGTQQSGAPVTRSATRPAARDDAAVRVSAQSLERMMQLASETMIASRRLDSLTHQLGQQTMNAAGAAAREPDAAHRGHAAALERAAWRCEELSTALYNEVLSSKMRPFLEGVAVFPRMVRDLARSLGKQVQFEILGETVAVDRDILHKLEAPLNHILRNAVDHGIESPEVREAAGKARQGHVVLHARHHAGMLTVEIRDDGGGIDPESIRGRIVERELASHAMAQTMSQAELMEFLFLPGFSTRSEVSEVSGRGVGLNVVQSMVHEVAGTVRVASEFGRSTTFTFQLPVTLSVVRAALARIDGDIYAFPLSRLTRVLRVEHADLRTIEGRQQFDLDGESVGLVHAASILELGESSAEREAFYVVVIGQPGQQCALTVDTLMGEQDLVVRPLDPRLGKVSHISAAALLETGDPVLIVDIEDLYQSVQHLLSEGCLRGVTELRSEKVANAHRVLVVDDSITVREVERQLLKKHGYEVGVAVDGQDGWNALRANRYDLVISDVDMPRMNGIELIRRIRRDSTFVDLPIIVVSYKDREEDRLAGMDAGADAYLTKASFHDDSLIAMVAKLIGKR